MQRWSKWILLGYRDGFNGNNGENEPVIVDSQSLKDYQYYGQGVLAGLMDANNKWKRGNVSCPALQDELKGKY